MGILTVLLRTVVLLQSIGSRIPAHVSALGIEPQSGIRCPTGRQIQRGLGLRLSNNAVLLVASSPEWDQLLLRASSPRIRPDFVASVEPVTEKDVQETVTYANRIGIPFLVVTGTHGWHTTLNDVHCGIQINMRRMNDTKVSRGGKTAIAGGGVLQHEIVQYLYQEKKMAVTGFCECVSVIGPLLGGGHSILQGLHGFSADNLVSARLVLANGSAITSSAEKNPDLFWAIRGAGHNFGVVTSFEVKLYDAKETWTMIVFTFKQDKLEGFFNTWNRLEVKHVGLGSLVLNGVFVRNPAIDTDYPVINFQIFYKGKNSVVEEYISAFFSLGPVSNTSVSGIEYGNLHDVGGFGLESPVCRKDENILGYPNSLTRWDADAMRAGFNLFCELTDDEKFATSAWLLESYGRKGVEAVPVAENAVSPEERFLHILTSPVFWWSGNHERDRERAVSYGQRIQEVVRRNSLVPPHAYVNYAVGREQLPEVYGRDETRLAKLRRLKGIYDPHNRFRFYAPIQ